MKPGHPRRLSDADHAVWAHFSQHVAVLPGRLRPAPPAPTIAPEAAPRDVPLPQAPSRSAPVVAAPVAIGPHPPGVDRATWQRFRSGKLAAARTLDLHGRTAERAFHALDAFLRAAHADRVRCVEVITGRGTGEEGGVLRRELPLWLNLGRLRPMILGAAHPHPANPGSVRLLLRRAR